MRAKDNEALEEVVTSHMLNVEGIETSETMITFRVYSRHDLDAMFSLGLDD